MMLAPLQLSLVIAYSPSARKYAQASFFYSTQIHNYQRMQFHGTNGRIEVAMPFNARHDRPTRLLIGERTREGSRYATMAGISCLWRY
jgi:hypothetical protein